MSGRQQGKNNGDASKGEPLDEYIPLGGGEYMEKSSGNPIGKEEILPEDKSEKGNGSKDSKPGS
jgi:hypothetical protein